MLLKKFFVDVYQPRKLRGKSKNTVRLYHVCFRNLAKTLGREPQLADLTNDIVSQHMQRLLDDGRSKATANKERCELVALWRYAAQLKLVDGWPDVQKEIEPIRMPQAWLHEDITKLLATANKLEGTIKDTDIPEWLWWTTLIRVMLDSGERIGAIREAKWEWIRNGEMLVPAEARKGGKRDKWYKLSDESCQLLDQLKLAGKGRPDVFVWTYGNTYLWRKYAKLLEKAGLPTGRKFGTHMLRRTCASVSFAAGLDPQEILGHNDRRVTMRYLDIRFSRQTQPSQILADWLRSKPVPPEQPRKQA